MKPALIRQAMGLSMSCDPVGNLLLTKFACHGARDACIFIPASIVFWLLKHVPANQDPSLQAPPARPAISQDDWDSGAPRALTVQCKQFRDAIRMTFELDRKPDLTVLLDRSNVEMMRQMMEAYRGDLIDLDA